MKGQTQARSLSAFGCGAESLDSTDGIDEAALPALAQERVLQRMRMDTQP